MLRFDSDVQYVRGVGPKRAELLRARGLHTVEDVLLRWPKRYEDRSRFAALDQLRPGQTVTLDVRVYGAQWVPTRSRGRLLDVAVTDGRDVVHVKWFNAEHLHRNRVFTPGVRVVLTGRTEADRYGRGVVLFNPEFEVVPEDAAAPGEAPGRYVPVYEETAGINSPQFRRIVGAVLDALDPDAPDPLPAAVRARRDLPDRRSALEGVHRPALSEDVRLLNARRSPHHRRFIFEEFLRFELTLALRRHKLRSADGLRFRTSDAIRERLKAILPFHPTAAQKRALKEIVEDLRAPHPMNRLLQGDVGCGKTIVAFETIVIAVENGYQAVIMAPTEILAEQHYWNARRLLAPLDYTITLLKKGVGKESPEALERIRTGAAQLVIGTHAVLEDFARFARLGLVVIDEQHRFGVLQRLRLMEKGARPNTLVMTATPIPRTLAMTFYGDLDLSVIDEMPPGRTPVRTIHVPEHGRGQVEAALRRELEAGRQAYVVYPLIEESGKLDLRSAREGCRRWAELCGSERVGLLHGRMKSEEKEAVMKAFTAGEIGVLVATTVVEVGVDVPNATVMLIEHAERFGLAQLHQLRGRVGRGRHPSTCFLMTPNRIGRLARDRVQAVAATTDGFRLAETDLRLRGPGEVAGTRQSGLPEFRVADLVEDAELLAEARAEAELWVRDEVRRDGLIAALGRRSGAAGLATVG